MNLDKEELCMEIRLCLALSLWEGGETWMAPFGLLVHSPGRKVDMSRQLVCVLDSYLHPNPLGSAGEERSFIRQ